MHLFIASLAVALAVAPGDLESARDRQDRAALAGYIEQLNIEAGQRPDNAEAQYRLAHAESLLAEVAMELRDKGQAKTAAEAGIQAARRAVSLKPQKSEYHRILGTLCGQVIPANVISGLKYGRCAQDSINKAVELDPASPMAYVSRGVGNYYMPPAFGGSVEQAIKDFEKASQLNPRSHEAWLWMGIALRKAGRNAEARKAFDRSLKLNPNRVWTKQQLDKTPAQ